MASLTGLPSTVLDADKDLVKPLFEFRNYGLPLPANWTTQNNGAAFGTDYYTRTAVAKSNIFVNTPNETKYFYQDLDSTGGRLNGPSWYLGNDQNVGSRLTLASVTDGTSNTVIFSEWIKGNSGANRPGLGAIYDTAKMTGGANVNSQTDVVNCQAQTSISWDYKGQYWTSQDTARGGGYWHINPPNKHACNTTTGAPVGSPMVV